MIQIPLKKNLELSRIFSGFTDSVTQSCFEGCMGNIFADNKFSPECCAVHLGEYIYVDGKIDNKKFFQDVFEYSKKSSLTVITLNKEIHTFIKNIYGEKCVFKKRYQMHTKKPFNKDFLLKNVKFLSKEYTLSNINEEVYNLVIQNEWSKHFVCNFKNYEDFSDNAFGYVIMKDNEVVSGTSCYSYYSKGYEVIIATSPQYRRKRLAMISASAFLLKCIDTDKIPHWDAANEKSLALSQKLGYSLFREYYGIDFI